MTSTAADSQPLNALAAQALSVGALIGEQTPILAERVHKAIPVPVEFGIRQLYLVGCGDSAIAAAAAQQAFRRFAGVPTVAEDAMSFARYSASLYAGQYPYTPAVVAISNSGAVSRVVEAAQNARHAGGYVIAVTGDPGSPLALASDAVIPAKAPSFPSAPGTRSYVEALLTLLLWAIRLGEVRGTILMDEAKRLRRELAALGDAVTESLNAAEVTLKATAEAWARHDGIDLLGAGPDRASARFGAAKIMEAAGMRAGDVDVEEFFHLNYFVSAPERTGTIVIGASNSPAASRLHELAPVLTALERPTLWLGAPGMHGGASAALPDVRPEFAPLVAAAHLSYFAAVLMNARAETPHRGHQDRWRMSKTGDTTRTSTLVGLGRTRDAANGGKGDAR